MLYSSFDLFKNFKSKDLIESKLSFKEGDLYEPKISEPGCFQSIGTY